MTTGRQERLHGLLPAISGRTDHGKPNIAKENYMAKAKQHDHHLEEANAPTPSQDVATENPDAPIYVRAIRIGHYDLTRHYPVGYDHPRAGQVFVLKSRDGISRRGNRDIPVHVTAAQQFSDKWMERVSDEEGRSAVSKQGRRPAKQAVITKSAADRSAVI